jgi:hypothetical protein
MPELQASVAPGLETQDDSRGSQYCRGEFRWRPFQASHGDVSSKTNDLLSSDDGVCWVVDERA